MARMPLSTKIAHITSIEQGAEKALVCKDPDLEHAISNTEASGIPPISVSPLQGQFLAIQARLMGAKTVLELGALGGYSSIWLAKTGAAVTSIEIDPKHQAVASDNLRAAGFTPHVILGDALKVLPELVEKERQFDMVFIDADWENQTKYFEWALKLTRKGGCILIDNVVQQLIDGHGGSTGEGTLVARVGAEESVIATLVPRISGFEGVVDNAFIDGFIIATVL
ncbi:Putative O-methyltransferase, family 3 [[Torrubiella] hemipterigena]|uniref:Putative O-methyltransferase, family 3 n=1 Tax=[Torrubiella] hemipterigena TaxID=1531966 RepID=A0A0A1TG08_9HYPO|nr:Putative O-methyltransferase, family 3 [[Torrubiella] hemipterigena]